MASAQAKKIPNEDSLMYMSSMPCCAESPNVPSYNSLPDVPTSHPRYGNIGFRMILKGSQFTYRSLGDSERLFLEGLADNPTGSSPADCSLSNEWKYSGESSDQSDRVERCSSRTAILSNCSCTPLEICAWHRSEHAMYTESKDNGSVGVVRKIKQWLKRNMLRKTN